MPAEIRIKHQYRGQNDRAHGGYFCGVVAREEPRIRSLRFRAPVPLDRGLTIHRSDSGLEVRDGDAVIAQAVEPGRIPVGDMTVVPSLEQAAAAAQRFAGFAPDRHPFPECFACGPQRDRDGLRIFVGPLDDERTGQLAGLWQPEPTLLDATGRVPHEVVWAALDCPGGWIFPPDTDTTGTFEVEIRSEIRGPAPLIVTSCAPTPDRPGPDSRQRYAGSALHDASGEVLAIGRAVWIARRA